MHKFIYNIIQNFGDLICNFVMNIYISSATEWKCNCSGKHAVKLLWRFFFNTIHPSRYLWNTHIEMQIYNISQTCIFFEFIWVLWTLPWFLTIKIKLSYKKQVANPITIKITVFWKKYFMPCNKAILNIADNPGTKKNISY